MKEQPNNNDFFIKNLIKKSGTEKAPPDFTIKVMDKIEKSEITEKQISQQFISTKSWLLMAAGFAALIALVFFVDWSFIGIDLKPESVDVQSYKKIIPYFTSFVDSLGSLFSFFTKSSIPAIVILGTLSLYIIDRLLKRYAPRRSYIL